MVTFTRSRNGTGADAGERPLGELLRTLADETSTLVRKELELARVEMVEKARDAGKGAGLFGVAAVLALLGLGCLTAAVVLALALVMPDWLAALLVSFVYLGAAVGAAVVGRDQIREAAPAAPEETIESVREDIRWAKAQLK